MDVALSRVLSVVGSKCFGTVLRRRFRHAVDNSGDSFGLVADWLARWHWWQSRPLVAGCSRSCAGNQSSNWPAGCLNLRPQIYADERR